MSDSDPTPKKPAGRPDSGGGADKAPKSKPDPKSSKSNPAASKAHAQGMVPGRERRRSAIERVAMRVIATLGVVGIGTATGAILAQQEIAGWIIGLSVSLASVILAGLLWSSREL